MTFAVAMKSCGPSARVRPVTPWRELIAAGLSHVPLVAMAGGVRAMHVESGRCVVVARDTRETEDADRLRRLRLARARHAAYEERS